MGIYIKGNIKMPKNCYNCWLGHECPKYEALLWNEISKERKADCPLSYISPHGRLGDLDKLENNLRLMANYQYGERQQGILGCCETIRSASTIIPASEE